MLAPFLFRSVCFFAPRGEGKDETFPMATLLTSQQAGVLLEGASSREELSRRTPRKHISDPGPTTLTWTPSP